MAKALKLREATMALALDATNFNRVLAKAKAEVAALEKRLKAVERRARTQRRTGKRKA